MCYVSMLKKYHHDPFHVVDFQPLEIQEDMSCKEEPIQIMKTRVKDLRIKTIPLVQIISRNHGIEEATWELKSEMKTKYPHLFKINL